MQVGCCWAALALGAVSHSDLRMSLSPGRLRYQLGSEKTEKLYGMLCAMWDSVSWLGSQCFITMLASSLL